jgi:hypothetical protein
LGGSFIGEMKAAGATRKYLTGGWRFAVADEKNECRSGF